MHNLTSKILPHGFDKSADLLSKRQNHEKDFFQNLSASQFSVNFQLTVQTDMLLNSQMISSSQKVKTKN